MRNSGLRRWPLAALLLTSLGIGPQAVADPAEERLIQATPFGAREPGADKPLFETLDPKSIGIDFFHVWTKRPGQLRNNTTGCGVAMGDYDGDGLVDVFLPRSTDGGRLYRNLGGFRFEDVSERVGILSPEGRWTTGATFVDIDNDGDLDLYVCGFDCPNHLYVNDGNGKFDEKAGDYGLDYQGSSAMAAFADYDRDGDLDVYLLTNHIPPAEEIEYRITYSRGVPRVPSEYRQYHDTLRLPDGSYGVIESGQYDHVYRNDGDAGFVDVTDNVGVSGNHKGLGVVWWDYDADGWLDAYVANDFYGPDRLYRNNHDGTFTDVAGEALPHTPWFSMGCDVGDLNNDGYFDAIGTDMSADSHERANVTMGDVQDDGWFLEEPTPRQYMRNAVYLGTGTRRVFEAAQITGLDSTNWTWSVRFVDLDQDGHSDIHVTNGMSRDWGNSDLKMAAMKLGPQNSDVYNEYWDRQELLKEKNFAFRNLGGLRLENVGEAWGLDHLGVSFGAAFGDLDNDGDLDLVVNNFEEAVTVARNNGHEGAAVRIRLAGRQSNRWGVGAVVRIRCGENIQTESLSLSRGFMSSSDPTIHFGLGGAASIDELSVEWPSGQRQTFRDLEVNQLYTITEPTQGVSAPSKAPPAERPTLFVRSDALESLRHQESEYDDFAREPLLPKRLSRQGPGLACADVDGDGVSDLFLGGAKGSWASLVVNRGERWASHGSGLFPVWSQGDRENLSSLLFDADGDGDNDLYLVAGSNECDPGDPSLQDALYVNDGAGEFAPAEAGVLPEFHDSGSIAAAADYDRDGDLDLFVGGRSVPGRYPEAPASRLLNNDAGKFADVAPDVAPGLEAVGMVTGALWTDANGDGWVDLLVTLDWGPIKLYLNDEGRLRDATEEAGLSETAGWWNGVAGRDLDGDGDLDYVVTNQGQNTCYHPTSQRPYRLLYGDFNLDGGKVLVEGKVDADGRLIPTRSKPEMQRAIPFVEAAYPTFAEYAAATLEEILGDQEVAESLQRRAHTAESVVLRNDGKGRFTAEPLPLMAQLSPCYGVVLTDFNGDGFTDCCVAQNSHSPRREIGNWDGGMSALLLGDKRGVFEAVPPIESGIIVPGDAQGLVAEDFNGDRSPDLAFAVNDEPVAAFENQLGGDARFAAVRLRGAAGNPTAVGARVTLRRSDGWSQTAEVHAGGGYLSQQPATLYFGLGPNAKVGEIEVRWPSGDTARFQPEADRLDLEFQQ